MSKSEIPRKRAVALKYNPHSGNEAVRAPEVMASGAGLIAQKILEKAREAGVYIHEDADLVEVLAQLDVGQQIPEELYSAVARILATVYALNRDYEPKR